MAARESTPAIRQPLLDWNKYYSTNEYNNKTTRARNHTLHFLIAQNHKWELLEPFIRSLNTPERKFKIVSADAKAHKLTPLMLAVMKGDIKVVRKLIEVANESKQLRNLLDAQDACGWTSLHHAAFAADEIFDTLLQAGADRTIKNHFLGTPDDIKSLISHNITSVSAPHVFVALADGTEILVSEFAHDRLRLRELLDLEEYRDLPYYPPHQQYILWRAFDSERYSPATVYEAWKSHPPKLLIRRCEALKHLPKASVKELVALEDLPLGTVIGPYSGSYDTTIEININSLEVELMRDERIHKFSAPPIFAHEIGNPLSIANFGFPNITYIPETVGDGSEHKIFISGGVKKGEGLLWDYGPGSLALTYGKQVLLGRKEMREFFRSGLSTIVKSVIEGFPAYKTLQFKFKNSENAEKAKEYLREYAKTNLYQSRLSYPLSSPGAILDLHFSGIVFVKEWLDLLDDRSIHFMQTWKRIYPFSADTMRYFLTSVNKFEEMLIQSRNPVLREEARAWVLAKIGELNIMQILKVFEYITQQARINSSIDWKAFLAAQEEQIAHYEWKDDRSPPIPKIVSQSGYEKLINESGGDHLLNTLSGISGADLSSLLTNPNACTNQ